MKKLNVLFTCAIILFSSFLFFGCDSNDSGKDLYKDQGFVAVAEVSYSTPNSSKTTLSSFFDYNISTIKALSTSEYESLDYKEMYGTVTYNISQAQTLPFTVGETIKLKESFNSTKGLYLAKIISMKKRYVYVKVLDANKIEIIDTEGYHFLYSTNWMEIKYFKG